MHADLDSSILSVLHDLEEKARTLVWWSPTQIARGDDIAGDPTKGERAWIIPETTGVFLRDLALKRGVKNILELGTSIGYSTIWLASALAENTAEERAGQARPDAQHQGQPHAHARLHSIDMRAEKHAIAAKAIADAGLAGHVILHTGMTADILPSLADMFGKQTIDLLFMDADRGHYHEYLPLIAPHLSDDAIIIADNALNMQERMKPFLESLTTHGWTWHIKDLDNGILIATKV